MAGWLDAVDALPEREQLEVCVVDSGSSAADFAGLRRLTRGRVDRLLRCPNIGYGAACNVGARATTAPVLLFSDPDSLLVSLPAGAFDREALRGTILGGFVEDDGARRSGGFGAVPSARRQAANLLLGRRAGTYARADRDPPWVSGGALVITREDLARLGGWATEYFLYFEDVDLCLRHRRRGGGVGLAPEFLVRHPTDPDRMHLAGLVFRSGRLFVARHQGRRFAAMLWLCLVAGYVPRRVLTETARRILPGREPSEPVTSMVLDTVLPSRIARRLDAMPPRDGQHVVRDFSAPPRERFARSARVARSDPG